MSWGKRGFVFAFGALALTIAIVVSKHNQAVLDAERAYQEEPVVMFEDIGTTSTLSVLPLVNWHTADDDYIGEQGVSYLVKTDHNTVLFDVGHNKSRSSPSPLERNMRAAGVDLSEVDTIFISHDHFDHVGGNEWMSNGTFSLGNEQVSLDGKRVYTPIPMTYPGIEPTHTPSPIVIAEGIATSGTIRRELVIGPVEEQALAIHVAGKGIVLIIGCGHQTMPKSIERIQRLFREPIYAVIGDLHYPVPTGRIQVAGLNAQRRFASGDGLFDPLTQESIDEEIALLESLHPEIVAVGGHDSSDEVIEQFHRTFGDRYRYVRVGEWIHVVGDGA